MKVETKTEDGILIISMEGSIDSKTAPNVQEEVLEAVQDKHKVIIALEKVDFVSSAGLRVLLMLYRQIKTNEGKVILAGTNEEIKEVMNITGFIQYFIFTDTVEEAKTKI